MERKFKISKEIYDHYSECNEDGRLKKAKGILEFERSKQIISRYLGKNKLDILDIGGGTGPYSIWLSSLGHKVYLVDPMLNLIKKAIENDTQNQITEINVGDIRNLKYSEEKFDLVICFGPFYHLTEKEDRIIALKELKRVTKPNGTILIAGISKYVSLIQSGLVHGLIETKEFKKIVEQDIIDGQHRNPIDSTTYFTTSIFMEPYELKKEVETEKFKFVECIAVEGPGWLHKNLNEIVKNNSRLTELMNLISKIETAKSIMGISTHFIIHAKK